MSVKNALLALLVEGEQYGYELRAGFEERTGGAWPLNIGQVYTTLDRLERDGMVERHEADADRQVFYSLTDAGRAEAEDWWVTPTGATVPSRDDVALKVALAATSPGVDVRAVIQTQRKATMSMLQDLTRTKRASADRDDAWELVADAMIFRAEAEVRWLDHTESRLSRRADRDRKAGATQAAAPAVSTSETSLDEVRS
ncbi:PadR family transcriptional regulator [Demequina sp.]|uniref:PadR family transcriptional regulator n=1 Tax=Demequina sp. TaxID=2050685 RepID=UPI0025BBDEBA|nr:PadR family transcriptional regulator [Demequina sp.]